MKIPEGLKWKATGETLGQGGQGSVFVVVDKTNPISERFALKVLADRKPKQAFERFYREIEAIKSIDHPHIIKIIDHSKAGDAFNFYVMELLEGSETLRKLLREGKNPFYGDSLRSLNFFTDILEALSVCEVNNPPVVHRDLSTANVLVLPDGSAKLIDFGLCQLQGYETITLIDENVGTPNYRAPECEFGSDSRISGRSDLYSAAKILWSAITGREAFAREKPVFGPLSMNEIFPDQPETFHLNFIFEKTIRQNPNDRFSVGGALAVCRAIRNAITTGRPPLEYVARICSVCGLGELEAFEGSHMVFGNPPPQGVVARQCNYCGHCFAIDIRKVSDRLRQRANLS